MLVSYAALLTPDLTHAYSVTSSAFYVSFLTDLERPSPNVYDLVAWYAKSQCGDHVLPK